MELSQGSHARMALLRSARFFFSYKKSRAGLNLKEGRFGLTGPKLPAGAFFSLAAKALFATRVFVGFSRDNLLEYWVKSSPSPNPYKTPPTIH
jgi:hypothetical protein